MFQILGWCRHLIGRGLGETESALLTVEHLALSNEQFIFTVKIGNADTVSPAWSGTPVKSLGKP